MDKSKIVDLQKCEDGTYSPSKKSKTKAIVKSDKVKMQEKYNKHHANPGADEFLAGIDVGLDFVEAVRSRVTRIMGMRD